MAVSLTTVKYRVTALLNAATQNADGTPVYSAAVGDPRRHASDISNAVDEAAVLIMEALCKSSDPEMRQPFMADATVSHGGRLPQHYGPPGTPKVQAHSGAGWQVADTSCTAEEIESYRDNPQSVYSEIEHDEEGSTVSGCAQIVDEEVFFTGYACKVPIATFVRADGATLLPDFTEPTCVRVAMGLCEKLGDQAQIERHRAAGDRDLAQIRVGSRDIAPMEEG